MALMPSGPSWAYSTTNLLTASNTPGLSHTPGSSNADSTAAAVITNCTHDVEYMVVGFAGEFASAANNACIADILVDTAGGSTFDTTNIPINDLICGHKVAMAAGIACPVMYHFPIWFKSGCSFGVRARCAGTAVAMTVMMWLFGGNKSPESWWCGHSVESIGIAAASSRGTAFTPSNSGTAWGSATWTNIGSTQVSAGGAVQFGLQTIQTTETAIQYLIEFGIGSTGVGPRMHFTGQTTESGIHNPVGPMFYKSLSGSQWQAHGLASGTAQALDGAVYVVH